MPASQLPHPDGPLAASDGRGAWTGQDVVRGLSLEGQTMVVTGASAGLGHETARCLAMAGADVVLTAPTAVRAEEALRRITADLPGARVRSAVLDLADLGSVADFVSGWRGPLHALVANAGVLGLADRQLTPQGVEMHFAVNFVGHHLLAEGLRAALARAGGRLVTVSSVAHRASPVVFDDISFRGRPYDATSAYAQSKTAVSLLAVAAASMWASDGTTANTLHPGAIWTSLQRRTGTMGTPVERRKTVAQGAATSVFLAASPEVAGVTGRYFEHCAPVPVYSALPGYYAPGVMDWAVDPDQAVRLWRVAHEWTSRWKPAPR